MIIIKRHVELRGTRSRYVDNGISLLLNMWVECKIWVKEWPAAKITRAAVRRLIYKLSTKLLASIPKYRQSSMHFYLFIWLYSENDW